MQKIEQLNINIEGLSGTQITSLVGKSTPDQLQSYITQINAIKTASNGLFTSSQIQQYITALSGVKASQAALILSTQGLTNAQISEILVKKEGNVQKAYEAMLNAGLLKSKQKLTNAELQKTIATKIGNEEDAKAIMASMGLSVAIEGEEAQTVQLTAKKLQLAVESGLLTEAQAQEIAMTMGVTMAQKTQIGSVMPQWIANMKAMTSATWAQVRATVAWLATNPAGWAILAVGAIASVISIFKKHEKKLEEQRQKIHELGETARSEIDSINSDFESTKSTVDDVAKRYATLAQGVENLGKATQNQGTLSNDEYAEFLDISNQLSDLFPRLTNGYDDNGNAILDLSGNVDTITSSLYDLVDAEKAVASVEMQEKMGDVWGEYSLNVKEYSDKYNYIIDQKERFIERYKDMYDLVTSRNLQLRNSFDNLIFEEAGIDVSALAADEGIYYWDELSEGQQNAIKDAYAKILEEYDGDMRDMAQKIKSSNKDFSSYLVSSLQGTDYYEELGEYKSIVNSLLSNYGYDTELNTLRGKENWDKALEKVENEIIKPFNSLDDADKEAFEVYYNKLLSIDPKAALADNIPKIEEYISNLAELLGMDENKLQIALGYDLESDKEELERAKRRLGFKDDPITKDEKEHNELVNSIASDLSKEQVVQINKIDIPEDVKDYTKDEYERFIKQLPKDFSAEVSFSIDTVFPQKAILTALSEQKEQGYLTEETLQSLKNIYGDLSEIITYTANGINLNTEAMTEYANQTAQAALVSTEMSEALAVREYNKAAKEVKALCNTNKDLSKAYKQGKEVLRDYINTNEDLDDSLKDTLRDSLSQMDDLADKINRYDALENSIRAATSALHDYLKATETANDKDNFETARSGLENAKKAYEQGWTQTDDYKTYMDYIGGYNNVDYLNPDKYIQRAERYLTEDISGIYAFLDDAVELSQGMVTKDANGAYTIAINDLDLFASRMDMTLSQVTDMLLAANDAWDFDIDFESLTDSIVDGLNAIDPASENARQNLDNFKETIESLKEAGYDTSELEEQFELVSSTLNADLEYTLSLSESSKEEVLNEAEKYADEVAEHIPAEKITFTAGIEGTNALISQVSEYRDGLAKGTEEFDHAQAVLAGLLQQKRELEVWNIDTSAMSEEMSGAILIIEQWQNAYADLDTAKTLGLDTSEAEAKLNNLTSKLNNLDDTTTANIGLNISENASVDEIKTALSAIDPNDLAENTEIKLEADDSQVKKTLKDIQSYISKTKANIKIGAKLEENFTENLQNLINTKSYSIKIGSKSTGNGGGITSLLRLGIPSHAQGTSTSGIKTDETALVGELGQESLVRNGQLYTLGNNGAEFVNLKKGDIIFSAEQTKELFQRSSINTRGRLVGNAFASGTLNRVTGNGSAGWHGNSINNGTSSSGTSSSNSSSASEEAKETLETFDWIEVAITRMEEAIERLSKAAENTYDIWSKRNENLTKEIDKTRNSIELQQKAYDGYMAKANSIGLSDTYVSKVQNGTIQIEDITDEDLADKISQYQTWYEKAIKCKDAIQDLNISLGSLAEQKFNNVVSQFEEQENVFTSLNDQLDASIDLAEAKGRLVSKVYYEAMRENERENNKLLVSQRDQMVRSLNESVASGDIEEYSEAWYDLQSQISDANKAIIESNTSLQEFDNSIRKLDWERFDLFQEKITNIADETDFVTQLLEKETLTDGYSNRGLTDKGITQLGAYASKYNIYMSQSEKYASKIREIEHEIAEDPANQDLIKRKEELIKQQQDLILSANAEKQAMIDLARDGYDAVLESLQELIDKRKEALNSEKELYEYQKTITEKTKNIASIRKQLSVFENDNSEEAKKTVQQLRVDLEKATQDLKDTEYEKYISDQENMLDEFYQDYSDKIDEKFEQVDILFQELIGIVNDNSEMIGNTIASVVEEAGYTLSSELSDIWNNTGTVISNFNGQFDTYATTIQTVLNGIEIKIEEMLKIADEEAKKKKEEINNGNVSGEGTDNTNHETPYQPIPTPETPKSNEPTAPSDTNTPQPSASVGTQIPNASGNWYYDSNGTAPTGDVNRWKPDYFMIDKIVEGRAYPYHIQAYINGKAAGGNGWVKGNQIGYKTGLKEAMYDHLAWTQENGGEIIRTSDGALLTPVPKGTSVFTRDMTNNLWNFADNPKAFIGGIAELPQVDIIGKANSRNVEINIDNITLPNVTKPEEFCDNLVNAIQNSNRAVKALRSVTVDPIAGYSSKRVNRF